MSDFTMLNSRQNEFSDYSKRGEVYHEGALYNNEAVLDAVCIYVCYVNAMPVYTQSIERQSVSKASIKTNRGRSLDVETA